MSKTCVRVLSRASADRNASTTLRRLSLISMSMKSITTMPPMSRSRSCLATSSAASRLLRKTVSSRFEVPTFLPVLTSITVRASVCSMISEPPLGSHTLRSRALCSCSWMCWRSYSGRPSADGVVVLDAVGEVGVEGGHVVAHVLEQRPIVDDHAAVLGVELLTDHPHGELGLAVQQRRAVGPLGLGLDDAPLIEQPGHVGAQLVLVGVLGCGAHDQAVLGGLDAVEDVAQPLADVVGQALGDAVGLRVGDQHDEPTGQRDLLGEASALGADRVLGDLAQHQLLGSQHLLDAQLARLLDDVFRVVLHVAAVQHGVLGRADVDERGLHARQHVLHLAEVDVAVDLADIVGGSADVVLDQGATLEHGDLGQRRANLDRHQVATDRATVALATAAPFDGVGIEIHRRRGVDRPGRLDASAALLLGGVARRLTVGCRGGRHRLRLTFLLGLVGSLAIAASPVTACCAGFVAAGGTDEPGGAGRVSPICGLRTRAVSAAAADGRPSPIRFGSSGSAPSSSGHRCGQSPTSTVVGRRRCRRHLSSPSSSPSSPAAPSRLLAIAAAT